MKNLLKKFFIVLVALLSFSLFSCSNNTKKLTELAQPTGLKYENKLITWNEVKNATNGYQVIVKTCDKEVINKVVTVTEVNVDTLTAGDYIVSVNALEVKDKYKASKVSNLNFTIPEEVLPKTALSDPTNITYDNATQTVKWDVVEHAANYKVKAVKKGTETIVINEQVIDTTEISLENLTEKDITISIQALVSSTDEEHLDSKVVTYDVTIIANKLATPTNLKFENDIISFDGVDNSDSYLIQVVDKATEEVVMELDDTIETQMDASELGKGDYTLKVKAYAQVESIYYQDSDVATIDFSIASLGELKTPEISGISGGNIVWGENNARGYEIEITKRGTSERMPIDGIEVIDNSFMLAGLDIENGDYTFSIKAVSNRHDTTESNIARYDFTFQIAKAFDAEAIAQFNGVVLANNWGGEHGKVELVELDGTKYALVTPTADGWGRVASPQFTINLNNNPILFLEMGTVFGGFHVQMTHDGTLYKVLHDTMKENNIAVSLTSVKTESGVALSATGIQTIAIRLGVDNSTTTTANDAKAHYHQMKVVYLTEYKEQGNVEVDLEEPKGLTISDVGTIKWAGVENATHYVVKVMKKETGASIFEEETDNTSIIAYNLEQGNYTISVKAINKTNSLFKDSLESTYSFTVTEVIKYTGNTMKSFVCGGGDEPVVQYNSDDTITLNPNGAVGWGWVWDPVGVTVDFDKNPLVIVNVNKSTEGGYLARATYNGYGTIVMANDTAGAFDTTKTLVFRASKNVDGNSQGSGIVEGYKFGMGVRGNGEIVIGSIRILTITEYKEAISEEVVLNTPTGLVVNNNSEIKWDSVENATAYNVTLTNIGTTEVINTLKTIRSVYSVATLPVGTYEIAVIAINEENELIKDSIKATFKFEVSEAVNYTAEEIAAFVKGDGDGDVRAELDSDTGYANYNPDKKGWGWLYPEVGATVDMSKNPFIVVTIESIESGYLARATYDGASTIVMINDTRNPSDTQSILVVRANVNVDGNPVSNEIVENYKFGFGFIDGSVNAVSSIRIIYVTPVVE